jgi:hypothetical protein
LRERWSSKHQYPYLIVNGERIANMYSYYEVMMILKSEGVLTTLHTTFSTIIRSTLTPNPSFSFLHPK